MHVLIATASRRPMCSHPLKGIITWASVGKAESENANRFSREKGAHGPRGSMRRAWKLGMRTRHCSLVTEFGVLPRKFGQYRTLTIHL